MHADREAERLGVLQMCVVNPLLLLIALVSNLICWELTRPVPPAVTLLAESCVSYAN